MIDEDTARRAFLALTQPIDIPAEEWPGTLVHFSSAEGFYHVMRSRSLLFSASSVMNDADEMVGALEIIRETLTRSEAYSRWRQRMLDLWPEFLSAFESYFDSAVWHDADNLYLFCWCAHASEHPTGKLSMWRAYGADGAGVAFAIKTESLRNNRYSATLPIQLHRTRYEDDIAFCATLMKIAEKYADHLDIARLIAAERGLDDACWWLFQAWFVASATRKHPGFSEEQEWRFIYITRWDGDQELTSGLEVLPVAGQLRPCFRLPIVDYARLGMPGTDIKDILSYVVIGPNTFDAPTAMRAVAKLLADAGVADVERKVLVCRTPYRTSR